jgi:hypothetical protein
MRLIQENADLKIPVVYDVDPTTRERNFVVVVSTRAGAMMAGTTVVTAGTCFCNATASASIRSFGALPAGTLPTDGTMVIRLAMG